MLRNEKAFEEDEARVAKLVKGYTPERVYHSGRWAPTAPVMKNS